MQTNSFIKTHKTKVKTANVSNDKKEEKLKEKQRQEQRNAKRNY